MKHWFQDRGFLWWARLLGMMVVTLFNCALSLIRWGILSPDHLVQSDALLLAAGSEVLLALALWLVGERFYSAPRGWAILGWLLGQGWWAGVAAVTMAISLYANVTYFLALHETLLDLVVRAGLPMALLIGFSVLPTKKRELTEAQIDERGQRELKKIQWQQRLQEAKDEPTRRALAEKDARKQEREREKAILLDMLAIAQDAGMDTQRFYVNTGEGYEWNKRGLQRALEGLKLWPPERATWGSDRAVAASDDASDDVSIPASNDASTPAENVLTTSGSRRTFLNAKEIAERWQALGITYTARTINETLMEARSKHTYALRGCRVFEANGKQERRAPLSSIAETENRILAERDMKVLRPTFHSAQDSTQDSTQEVTQQSTQEPALEATQEATQFNTYDLLVAE